MSTPPGDEHPPPPGLDELLEAARLLGAATLISPFSTLMDHPAQRLAIASIVVAVADEALMRAERETKAAGGDNKTLAGGAEVTARLIAGADPAAIRHWLTWRTGHLLHQMETAQAKGKLDASVGDVTGHCLHAAGILMAALTTGRGTISDLSVEEARTVLIEALKCLDRIDCEPPG